MHIFYYLIGEKFKIMLQVDQINITMLVNNKISSQTDDSQLTNGNGSISKRIAFKMVRSTFQPPEQTEDTVQIQMERKVLYPSYSKMLMANKKQSFIEIQPKKSQQISFNPSVEFINSLSADNQIENFDQGDCIPINNDERWIVISGTVKIIGINGCSFIKKQGFIFFASAQTKRRVKQVVAICSTTLYRIPYQIFKQNIRSFLYVKNAQKVKYLKHCPFLGWGQSLSQDLAIAMDFINDIEKDTIIYKEGDEADCLYFVKEGIVLLQRTGKIGNKIILDYEKYYEVNYVNQQQGIIIVRKGMLFGADGILIKQVKSEQNLLQSVNPQNQHDLQQNIQAQQRKLKSSRIYSAKSIGKCQLYKIDKQVIETYLKSHNQIAHDGQIQMSSKQLDRICLQYTNLLMGNHQVTKQVKKKNLQFKVKVNQAQAEQMDKKKKKIQIIKLNQKKLKKVASVQHKRNDYGKQQSEEPFSSKKSKVKINFISKQKQKNTLSFPRLSRNYVQNLIMKKLQTKQHQQYLNYKKKIQNQLFSKEVEPSKIYEPHQVKKREAKKLKQKKQAKKQVKKQEDTQNLQIMKVKSYRSLLSPIGAYNT